MNHTPSQLSNHFLIMACIMIFSGLLSTMNVWVDKWDDIRLSMNDAYMILLMTGWMLLFMGLYSMYMPGIIIGFGMVILCLYGIRTQMFVTEDQFLLGMIPHHSMAVHMSKKLERKSNTVSSLLESIISSQEQEIHYMKQKLRTTN